MGRISVAFFKNRNKQNRQPSEVSESKKKKSRDSGIDVDHFESTAPINSDRSTFMSSGSARETSPANLGLPTMDSVETVQQNGYCERWSYNTDINTAKMCGPEIFRELTTLEALNANSDEENEDIHKKVRVHAGNGEKRNIQVKSDFAMRNKNKQFQR